MHTRLTRKFAATFVVDTVSANTNIQVSDFFLRRYVLRAIVRIGCSPNEINVFVSLSSSCSVND